MIDLNPKGINNEVPLRVYLSPERGKTILYLRGKRLRGFSFVNISISDGDVEIAGRGTLETMASLREEGFNVVDLNETKEELGSEAENA